MNENIPGWFSVPWKMSKFTACIRVPTAQGKQGKWPKKIPVRENTGNLEILPKHREFGNFAKTQGICFSQVVTSLILKVKDILIFATKIFFKGCQVSFVCVIVTNHVNWHRENLQSGREKNRENTGNLKMQFEWVP